MRAGSSPATRTIRIQMKVSKVKGKVYAQDSSGTVRLLKAGSIVNVGDNVFISKDTSIEYVKVPEVVVDYSVNFNVDYGPTTGVRVVKYNVGLI